MARSDTLSGTAEVTKTERRRNTKWLKLRSVSGLSSMNKMRVGVKNNLFSKWFEHRGISDLSYVIINVTVSLDNTAV